MDNTDNKDINTSEKTTPETNSNVSINPNDGKDAQLETPNTEPQIQQPTATPSPEPNDLKKPVNKKFIFIILILLVLGISSAAYLFVIKDKKPTPAKSQQTQTTDANKTVIKPTEIDQEITRFTTPTTGETWYTEPKPMEAQGYATNEPQTIQDGGSVEYSEIGKRGDNVIILSTSNSMGTTEELYEKAPDGKVSAIIHPLSNHTYTADDDKYLSTLRSDVMVNTDVHYDSLSVPQTIDLGGNEKVSIPSYVSIGTLIPQDIVNNNVTENVVKKFGSSMLVKTERKYVDTGLTAIAYEVKTPIKTVLTMTYSPIGSNFKEITWSNGASIDGTFGSIVRGCGAGISVSRGDNVKDSDFIKTGTTSSGETIYNFVSNDAALVQKAWQETKDYYDGSDATKANITIDDFVKNHGVFAYKSQNSGWLIFTNDAYAPVGGCAKPVVYLYPTTPEQVTVKVGADVKVSAPNYDPKTGWHVFAWPNGQLQANGQVYDSLFWEGPGHGNYPAITTGTVVKRADVLKTMETQLKLQGLNQNETNQFLDYWQANIPNKPYVRLSWFNTTQMNELAPLLIIPKPTTVIRTFLDMSGSDSYFAMPAPVFSAPARNGFTVVEWGGLSLKKLY